MNKDVKKFMRRLHSLGFETEVGKHVAVTFNGRRVSTLAVSPSDGRRWEMQARTDIRRETGIVV